MRTPWRGWAIAASILLAASLAACGGDDTGSPSATPTVTAEAVTVTSASSSLGEMLVDDAGMSLYLFTDDPQGGGASVCQDECLVAWPPLLGDPRAGGSVEQSLLGTITRSDGTTQATYNGWPLYYYFQDTEPGDTTGQGDGDVWWVVDPLGNAIR